jgi:hypothetical protein
MSRGVEPLGCASKIVLGMRGSSESVATADWTPISGLDRPPETGSTIFEAQPIPSDRAFHFTGSAFVPYALVFSGRYAITPIPAAGR